MKNKSKLKRKRSNYFNSTYIRENRNNIPLEEWLFDTKIARADNDKIWIGEGRN